MHESVCLYVFMFVCMYMCMYVLIFVHDCISIGSFQRRFLNDNFPSTCHPTKLTSASFYSLPLHPIYFKSIFTEVCIHLQSKTIVLSDMKQYIYQVSDDSETQKTMLAV